MRKLLLALIFVSNLTKAEDQDTSELRKSNYPINWKYRAGEYLIYECERSFYACVDKEGNDACQKERNIAIEKKEKNLKCAPLKKFQNKKSCVIEDYKVVDINAFRRFCYPK